MSKNSSDSVWENLLIIAVFVVLAVFGYRKAKPYVESWLADRGVRVGDLADQSSWSPTELFVSGAAILLGIALLVAILRTWRRVRRGKQDGDKKKARVWR